MLPRSFYFLRHGETDWNVQRRMQGHTDIPLNATGRRQATEVVTILKNHPIDRIITSNLARAHETAQIINRVLKKPIDIDEDLKERHYGVLEGKTLDDLQAFREMRKFDGMPLEENGHPCAPQGETYADFKNRTTLAMTRYLHDHASENILFVSHGGVYRALCRGIMGLDTHSPNAHPVHFEKDDAGWRMHELSK